MKVVTTTSKIVMQRSDAIELTKVLVDLLLDGDGQSCFIAGFGTVKVEGDTVSIEDGDTR